MAGPHVDPYFIFHSANDREFLSYGEIESANLNTFAGLKVCGLGILFYARDQDIVHASSESSKAQFLFIVFLPHQLLNTVKEGHSQHLLLINSDWKLMNETVLYSYQ